MLSSASVPGIRTLLISALLTAAAAAAQSIAPRPGVDHVAALARLYGAVRYFYPSDAAAVADWALAIASTDRR